jgi:hypothetical protein
MRSVAVVAYILAAPEFVSNPYLPLGTSRKWNFLASLDLEMSDDSIERVDGVQD